MIPCNTHWRRVTCGALAWVFALSAAAGSICTGHKAPHAAGAGNWSTSHAAKALPIASVQRTAANQVHAHRHEGHAHHGGRHVAGGDQHGTASVPHHHDASVTDEPACDAPVFVSKVSEPSEKADIASVLDLPHIGAAYPAQPLPGAITDAGWFALNARPPPLPHPLSLAARLRI